MKYVSTHLIIIVTLFNACCRSKLKLFISNFLPVSETGEMMPVSVEKPLCCF